MERDAAAILLFVVALMLVLTNIWLTTLMMRVRKLEDRTSSHGFFPNEKKAEPTEKF